MQTIYLMQDEPNHVGTLMLCEDREISGFYTLMPEYESGETIHKIPDWLVTDFSLRKFRLKDFSTKKMLGHSDNTGIYVRRLKACAEFELQQDYIDWLANKFEGRNDETQAQF